MTKIPQKVSDRIIKTVGRFQRILQTAKDRDINEADTVKIVSDMLSDVFGYDKYVEVTSEFSIRGTFCDLAIKTNDKIQYLIEVKAIGLDLKEHHLRQVVSYGANQGVQWVILTNGIVWEIYKIHFEKPLSYDLVHSFNFLALNPRKTADQETLFLICKSGLTKEVREDFYIRVQSVNRFVIGAIIMSDKIVNVIKRELRLISPGLKVDNSEIQGILKNEVLKREVLEGEPASKAKNRIKRIATKQNKRHRIVKAESEKVSLEKETNTQSDSA